MPFIPFNRPCLAGGELANLAEAFLRNGVHLRAVSGTGGGR